MHDESAKINFFLFTLPSLKATFSHTTSSHRLLTSLMVVEEKVNELRVEGLHYKR